MLIDELKNLKLKNWSAVLNEDEILWLELNKVHKSTNTLSSEVREEFGKILSVFEKGIEGEFSGKIPAGLVIHSKKQTGFCAGADVNAKNSNKWSPLHSSKFNKNEKIVKLLLAFGADINAEDDMKRTPTLSSAIWFL